MEHDLEKMRNLKIILSASEDLLGLKINFQKVSCFVSLSLKTRMPFMPNFLVVGKVSLQPTILASLYIIRDLKHGNTSRKVYKSD
jgi:hypothetical protein